jgi:hypothetical protein
MSKVLLRPSEYVHGNKNLVGREKRNGGRNQNCGENGSGDGCDGSIIEVFLMEVQFGNS